jgi:exosortase/archaeosortase family protein
MGGFARDDLVISNGGDHSIMIEEGCSAFQNVSLASLIWISLLKLDTLRMRTAHLWICAAMAVATVALNTVRLALMAQSESMYEFWHNGAGVPIVSTAMLGVMLIICLGGLQVTARP